MTATSSGYTRARWSSVSNGRGPAERGQRHPRGAAELSVDIDTIGLLLSGTWTTT